MNAPTQSLRSERLNGSRPAAFTIVELLVILAVLAFGAMLLVPALARTQPDSRAARCLDNHRQLTRAWLMYAVDNNDRLVTAWFGGTPPSQPTWVGGWLDWTTSPDNTNTILLTNPRYSSLALYCGKDARLFKCPADQYLSSAQRARGWEERVRSIAQNPYAANGNINSGPSSDLAYAQVKKLTELLNPQPAETWVSMDEHPESINDGVLLPPDRARWWDWPANYHEGGASAAFADGHVEMHRWQGSLLNVPVKYVFSAPPVTASDPDLLWVRYHTPRKAGAN